MRRLHAEDVLVAAEEDEADICSRLDERRLVGRLSLVRDEAVLFARQDGVAEREVHKEIVEVAGLGRVALGQVGLDLRVVEGREDLLGELCLGLVVARAVAVRR